MTPYLGLLDSEKLKLYSSGSNAVKKEFSGVKYDREFGRIWPGVAM
jgi:hypothetical protein